MKNNFEKKGTEEGELGKFTLKSSLNPLKDTEQILKALNRNNVGPGDITHIAKQKVVGEGEVYESPTHISIGKVLKEVLLTIFYIKSKNKKGEKY